VKTYGRALNDCLGGSVSPGGIACRKKKNPSQFSRILKYRKCDNLWKLQNRCGREVSQSVQKEMPNRPVRSIYCVLRDSHDIPARRAQRRPRCGFLKHNICPSTSFFSGTQILDRTKSTRWSNGGRRGHSNVPCLVVGAMAVVRCRGDCRRSVEVRTIWSGFVKRKPYHCVGQVISGGGLEA
jgi:hypothetical protein